MYDKLKKKKMYRYIHNILVIPSALLEIDRVFCIKSKKYLISSIKYKNIKKREILTYTYNV